MSNPFDFDAWYSGTDLPKFEVPLYRVVNQRRIVDLDEQIRKASETPAGDERETTVNPVTALTEERGRLKAEQEASASWVELRALSAEEFYAISRDRDKDVLDQIAAQSEGTRNPGDRAKWEQVQASALPGAWTLFVARANEILEQTLVMPDFSLNGSASPSTRPSSAS